MRFFFKRGFVVRNVVGRLFSFVVFWGFVIACKLKLYFFLGYLQLVSDLARKGDRAEFWVLCWFFLRGVYVLGFFIGLV